MVPPARDGDDVTQRVEFTTASVPLVRARLQRWMGTRGVPSQAVEDARLVVSELLGNAVRHASPLPDGKLEVAWGLVGGTLEVSVRDGGGPTTPQIMDPPPLATGGRGVAIVSTIAERLWVSSDPPGRTVHAVLAMR